MKLTSRIENSVLENLTALASVGILLVDAPLAVLENLAIALRSLDSRQIHSDAAWLLSHPGRQTERTESLLAS